MQQRELKEEKKHNHFSCKSQQGELHILNMSLEEEKSTHSSRKGVWSSCI